MFRWLAGRGATQRQVERQLAMITDELWSQTLSGHVFLRGLSPLEDQSLRLRSAWLLASKRFGAVQGMTLTEEIMLSISVQAALPILKLDTVLYERWTEIILYPGGFVIPYHETDENGVVHEYLQEASGEAWEGGPVILSWEDARSGTAHNANVVIHEFAHKLDMHANSEADGMPSLSAHPHLSTKHWREVLKSSFTEFTTALSETEGAIPAHVDPETDEAAPWFDLLPLDPYAATDTGEFFAVSTEAFFVDPVRLERGLPCWYDLLAQYYRQDPLTRLAGVKENQRATWR
ncbi:zinc-dependent peptidase [Paenalcaligenes niemegkensis]|uniref:M90 family metallopeptidase n=1 Tax=Paenalcaligenes niemegkensis TaxID=2895469 RepID=UPI001EE8E4FC|nr:M90 family metallopeptidase [Paenalcaligenes niemegkensis]MCQ9616155.1 zinc-dependent peptidase [Paenalcaligenes niemegkensis]